MWASQASMRLIWYLGSRAQRNSWLQLGQAHLVDNRKASRQIWDMLESRTWLREAWYTDDAKRAMKNTFLFFMRLFGPTAPILMRMCAVTPDKLWSTPSVILRIQPETNCCVWSRDPFEETERTDINNKSVWLEEPLIYIQSWTSSNLDIVPKRKHTRANSVGYSWRWISNPQNLALA